MLSLIFKRQLFSASFMFSNSAYRFVRPAFRHAISCLLLAQGFAFSLAAAPPGLPSAKNTAKKSEARLLFEYAYQVEKSFPAQAISMYEWALELRAQESLEKELVKTALWRLIYLHEDYGNYLQAAFLCLKMQKAKHTNSRQKRQLGRLAEKMLKKAKQVWRIDFHSEHDSAEYAGPAEKASAFLRYLKQAIVNLDLAAKTKTMLAAESVSSDFSYIYFLRALKLAAFDSFLKHAVLEFLFYHKAFKTALKLLHGIDRAKSGDADYLYVASRLDYASLHLRRRQWEYAQYYINRVWEREAKLQPKQKLYLYYALGRLAFAKKEYGEANLLFQKAAQWGAKESMYARAAYSLYLAGDIEKAYVLMSEKQPGLKKSSSYILWLVLGIKHRGDAKAKQSLSKLRPYLQAASKYQASSAALPVLRDALSLVQE